MRDSCTGLTDLVQYQTACDKDKDFFEDFRRRYRHAFELYLVRDSKNAGGAVLTFSAQAWQELVGQVKAPS